VTPKELKAIRDQMGLTQAELAERLKIARNTVARMERSLQAITPSMALLIGYVARDHERHRQRPKDTDRHEGQGLGGSGNLRVRRGKQQDAKKSPKRRSP
jgi:DNA-binding XRE family transcriptional regulator